MRITKIVLGIGVVLALASCSTTKTSIVNPMSNASYDASAYSINTSTDGVVAKQGEMSEEDIKNWPHMDIYTDSVPGMSTGKAYDFVKDKKGEIVIVGIVDSGVDIEHKDLKHVVWTNPGEIPNNGIDDDNNGYVDDIHGWNFLGGDKGTAAPEQLEISRIVHNLAKRFEGKTADDIAEADKKDFEYYTELNEKVSKKYKAAVGQKTFYQGLINTLKKANAGISKLLGKEDYTYDDIKDLKSEDENIKTGLPMIMRALQSGSTVQEGIDGLKGAVDYFSMQADNHYNLDFNGRVTGDNPEDINDKVYGNNIVLGAGPDELHGTHVAGIVGAYSGYGVGGYNGVAQNIRIMTGRAVPDGDEYDKDVALAIRYVVDNGAKVVNMSFGKAYSPHSEWVYDAIKYAAEHDVLLVKAAGNNGENIDLDEHLHFPTDSPDGGSIEIANNVLTVGASTRHLNEKLCASFSNYGKTRVDIFAPGLEIYATVPHNDYKSIQGTSMASPAVAGVAALVRSYYPSLSANQVKNIIIQSGVLFTGDVIVPGTQGEKKNFLELSKEGRLLNAYNALRLADKIVNSK